MTSSAPPPRNLSLFELLNQLEDRRVSFRLDRIRDSVLVEVVVPGEHWEIEFFEDGRVEIERFRSDGQIDDAHALEALWRLAE